MEEVEIAGLRCSQVLEQLSAYLDDELPALARARVDTHLAGCPNCAHFGGQIHGLMEGLRSKPAEPPPTGLLERLQAQLNKG